MKSTLLTVAILLFSSMAYAQNNPVDFEADGNGADWEWRVFENDDDPALEIIDNPDATGANTSAKVAKFTARSTGQSFAGFTSGGIGTFTLDETNRTIRIMVWKSVISDVGIKLEAASGWSEGEIKVANTLTNQWEELTFDFSDKNNPPAEEGGVFSVLTIFPDFNERTEETVNYIDNVVFGEGGQGGGGNGGSGAEPASAAPTPTVDAADVLSIFSDAYSNVGGTDFNPDWGQGTSVSFMEVASGDTVMKYAGLNYQGTQFASDLDVSGYQSVYVDMWAEEATSVDFYLINPGEPPVEIPYTLTGVAGEWTGFEIPLTEFSPVDLTAVGQIKVDDGGSGTAPTVFFDNWFFYNGTATSNEIDGELANGFVLEQNYPNPFNPSTNISYSVPVSGEVTLEVFNIQGQKVATLVNGTLSAGAYEATFEASQFASGIYIYRLTAANTILVRKMMLVK